MKTLTGSYEASYRYELAVSRFGFLFTGTELRTAGTSSYMHQDTPRGVFIF